MSSVAEYINFMRRPTAYCLHILPATHWTPQASGPTLILRVSFSNLSIAAALKHQIWAQRASGDRLRDRVAAFNAACRSGVYAAIFEGKTDDQIKCAYNDLLKRKRKSNDVDVNRASGTSPDPLEDEAAKLVSTSDPRIGRAALRTVIFLIIFPLSRSFTIYCCLSASVFHLPW